MFNRPKNLTRKEAPVVLTVFVYLLLIVYYVFVVFTLSYIGMYLMQDALTTKRALLLIPAIVVIIMLPYYGCIYIHRWTKTRSPQVSRIVFISALIVWALFGIGYAQGQEPVTYTTLIHFATWIAILWYHYNVIFKTKK